MPISKRDIWRSAKLIVDQHGADAPIRAAQRADELLPMGDVEGQAGWKRILRAVEELTRMERRDGELMNGAALSRHHFEWRAQNPQVPQSYARK